MSELRAVVQAAKESGDLHLFDEALPYARFIGARFSVEEGSLLCVMPFLQTNVGNPVLPALHGGVIGGLLEHVALCHVLFEMELERLPKTINLTIDYLRSGRPETTYARAELVRRGRRVQTVRATAYQSDRKAPITIATVHLLTAE